MHTLTFLLSVNPENRQLQYLSIVNLQNIFNLTDCYFYVTVVKMEASKWNVHIERRNNTLFRWHKAKSKLYSIYYPTSHIKV